MSDFDALAVRATSDILQSVGRAVIYDPDEAAKSVDGVFDYEYFQTEDVDGIAGVATREPVLAVNTSDFDNLTQGDDFDIGGERFVVTNLEPDGLGGTILRLRSA